MSVAYLDVDDEITSAVGRLRNSDETDVLFVLPPGSRIATSRINFRLLAREARERDLSLAIASGEPEVRALAVAAGLRAFPSLREYEAARIEDTAPIARPSAGPIAAGTPLVSGGPRPADQPPVAPPLVGPPVVPPPPVGPAGRESPTVAPPTRPGPATALGRPPGPAGAPDPMLPLAGTPGAAQDGSPAPSLRPRTAAQAVAGSASAAVVAPPLEPRSAERGRRETRGHRRLRLVVGLGFLLALVVATGAAAYTFLPGATIRVTPRAELAGPLELQLVADARVRRPDPAKGLVPADPVDIPLRVTDTFKATGTRVQVTRATGTVRFTSENTLDDVTIPAGTRVGTADGPSFVTIAPVVVPRASFVTGQRGRREAAVEAVEPGPEGNVPAGSIRRVPRAFSSILISVTNPRPTTGGKRDEVRFVQESDYTAALDALRGRLDEALASALREPETTPAGLTLFPQTAETGEATPDRSAAELVGTQGETFQLTLRATATALAVDEAELAALAAGRLRDSVADGWEIFEDSIRTEVSDGTVKGRRIEYAVQATAEQWRQLDQAQLLKAVRGKPIAEARAMLEQYGEVEIEVWPDFLATLPAVESRLDLVVLDPERAGG